MELFLVTKKACEKHLLFTRTSTLKPMWFWIDRNFELWQAQDSFENFEVSNASWFASSFTGKFCLGTSSSNMLVLPCWSWDCRCQNPVLKGRTVPAFTRERPLSLQNKVTDIPGVLWSCASLLTELWNLIPLLLNCLPKYKLCSTCGIHSLTSKLESGLGMGRKSLRRRE